MFWLPSPAVKWRFEYHECEPDLEFQAEFVRQWNEWTSVLSEDRSGA